MLALLWQARVVEASCALSAKLTPSSFPRSYDDFDRDFQEQFVTEFGWGGTWARGGLERRERSILNLGMLAALGRLTEFETHFRGAIKNNISQDELREILLQITAYCGIPMGVEVFRIAKRVINEKK